MFKSPSVQHIDQEEAVDESRESLVDESKPEGLSLDA